MVRNNLGETQRKVTAHLRQKDPVEKVQSSGKDVPWTLRCSGPVQMEEDHGGHPGMLLQTVWYIFMHVLLEKRKIKQE